MTELGMVVGTEESLRADGVGLVAGPSAGPATGPVFVRLSQGFLLVPVGEEAWKVIGCALAEDLEVAVNLSRFLAVVLGAVGLRPDAPGPVAFLELSEYKQSGVAAVDGTVVEAAVTDFDGSQWRTPEADWAFNRVLRRLGARAGASADECAALGLTQYLASLGTALSG